MAASWKGYRRIVVRDRVFYWRYDYDYYWGPGRVIARLAERPHVVMIANLQGGGGWVTPRLACECIERALFRGWLREHDSMQFNHAIEQGKA